jgi:hypothetical protein
VILVYALVLLIVLALLLQRNLHALTQRPYRGGWKLAAGVMSLFIAQAVWVIYAPGQTFFQLALLMVSQLALLGLLFLNRHLPGAKLFALGLVLNTLVMAVNGGWMPITPETYHLVHPERPVELYARPPRSKNIILPRSDANLWILSDLIPVSLPWYRTAMSPGDVVLILGAAQFIWGGSIKQEEEVAHLKGSLF